MVITNRFIKKKSMAGWAFRRILQTKLRYYLVRFLLGSKLDGSGGFRLYDLKIIKLKDIFEAEDNYYNFFWISAFILEYRKYKISEIPINLPNRVLGSSKMEFSDVFIGLIKLMNIFIKYRLVL